MVNVKLPKVQVQCDIFTINDIVMICDQVYRRSENVPFRKILQDCAEPLTFLPTSQVFLDSVNDGSKLRVSNGLFQIFLPKLSDRQF
jgi:hypothetical protein